MLRRVTCRLWSAMPRPTPSNVSATVSTSSFANISLRHVPHRVKKRKKVFRSSWRAYLCQPRHIATASPSEALSRIFLIYVRAMAAGPPPAAAAAAVDGLGWSHGDEGMNFKPGGGAKLTLCSTYAESAGRGSGVSQSAANVRHRWFVEGKVS